jgi:MoaA/NifB/PqqE/SkfB family radical SAM enzyme
MQPNSLSFNLEPTFRCNLECPMCPRFSSEDPYLDMSMDTFDRIVDGMDYAHTVDFTGWGEPLLHKDICQMIREAGDHGCLTTMTSNGTALNEQNSLALIKSGLDRLVVSVDGMRAETYEPIRIGSSFEKVSRRISDLASLIRSSESSLELGIAFTIQEKNAEDLNLIVNWMKTVGASVMHLKHLNVLSNHKDWDLSFLKYVRSDPAVNRDRLRMIEDKIAKVRAEAEEQEIRVEMHSELPLTSSLVGRHCLATPLDSVYFSYEGKVSPCCHFGHHVSRFFDNEFYPASSLSYGDIRRQSFEDVWNDESFRSFRQGFRTKEFPQECRTCYLLYGK